MREVVTKLVGVADRFVAFVREVDRGIAVGRGYASVRKNVRDAGCRPRVPRGWVRSHRAGRWGVGGRI